ncbi:hypothetical protein Noca_2751 [Nocardioides sp. JS614]|nr:hypothetical protein Noca_2751 [Nocardioides sp. JS614]
MRLAPLAAGWSPSAGHAQLTSRRVATGPAGSVSSLTVSGVPIASAIERLPAAAEDAITKGHTVMGAPDALVVVTNLFVPTVQRLTGESDYHADRGGGDVAARTVTTTDGDVVVIVNWEVMATKSLGVLERVLAHESGHLQIMRRAEEPYELLDEILDDPWDFTVASMFAVCVDEYRCEAAVFAAGYSVENSHTDFEYEGTLTGLNIASIGANFEYQKHLDVARLRSDVLAAMSNHTKTLGCMAARHLHGHPFDPANLSTHGQANWSELVAPAWVELLGLLAEVPDASSAWPGKESAQTATSGISMMNTFCKSLGYLAEPDKFWIKMDLATFNQRLDRANAEMKIFDQR